MKKIFSTLLVLACALFVSIACTNVPTPETSLTVEELAEALPLEGGQGELTYSIVTPVADAAVVLGEPSATWLHDLAVVADANKITFVYDANNDTPQAEPREATFTVTYGALEPVLVTVKQLSNAPQFTVTMSDASPESVRVSVTPNDLEMTYLIAQTTDVLMAEYAQLLGTEGFEHCKNVADVFMQHTANSYVGWTDRLDYQLKKGVFPNTEDPNFYEGADVYQWYGLEANPETGVKPTPYLVVCGVARDPETKMPVLTTMAEVIVPELLPYPELVIPEEQLAQSVVSTAGEFYLDISVKDAIEGLNIGAETKVSWLKPNVDEIGAAILEDGKLKVAFDANPYGVDRSATLTLLYNYAAAVNVTVTQAANADAEPITLTVTVKECHWDHILVDIVPSDETVTCCIGAISKEYYEGGNYLYDGTDIALVNATLTSYNTQRFTGKQTDYKITKFNPGLSAAKEGETYYVWAYAADGGYGEASGAISEVVKKEVTIVYDKPAINILSVAQTVDGVTTNLELTGSGYSATYQISPKAATFVVTYEVTNKTANGEVRWNGNYYISNSYGVIVEDSEKLDTEKNQVTFSTNAYDASKKYHTANLNIAYYGGGAEDKSSDATAQIKLTQLAE